MTVGAGLLCSHSQALGSSEVFPIPVSPYFISVSHQTTTKNLRTLLLQSQSETSFIKLMTIPYLSSHC